MRLYNSFCRLISRGLAQAAVGNDLSIRLARGELGATVRDKKL